MNNNTFDERLKLALENIEAPYDPETWSKLAARMDSLPAAADGAWMDESLAGRLEHLEAPYQPAHWDRMAARLDQEDNRRRRVWMYKLAEAAIFLLLIANVLYMTQGFDPNGGPVAQNNASETQGTKHKTSKSKEAESRKMNSTSVAETGLSAAVSGLAALAAAVTTAVAEAANPSQSNTETTPALANTASPNTLTGAVQTLLNNDAAMAAILKQSVESLPGTDLYPLVAGLHRPNTLPMINKTPKTGRLFAGLSTGVQFDRIHNGTANTISGQQMAFDADIVYRKGKWGVSTGVRYARKHFQPKPQVEIYAGDPSKGYYGSYISEVEASVVSIPVQATRRVGRIGKATAHALAGFTANVSVEKSYRNKTVYYPGQTPDPNPVGGAPVFNRDADGWLENGALSDNHYISADVGLRVETPVGKRTMMFVESVYQHALSGNGFVNPSARINTVGVYAGVVAGL